MNDIPLGFCQCGCGGKTRVAPENDAASGRVKGRPARYLPGHTFKKTGAQYRVDEVTGCWIWQWSRTRGGYGIAWDAEQSRTRRAHRLFYERVHGPIPDGLHLDHLCVNPACVNPDHLEPVTQQENNRRFGERFTHCKRGHELTPGNTYIKRGGNGRRECRTCANEQRRARYQTRKAAA